MRDSAGMYAKLVNNQERRNDVHTCVPCGGGFPASARALNCESSAPAAPSNSACPVNSRRLQSQAGAELNLESKCALKPPLLVCHPTNSQPFSRAQNAVGSGPRQRRELCPLPTPPRPTQAVGPISSKRRCAG